MSEVPLHRQGGALSAARLTSQRAALFAALSGVEAGLTVCRRGWELILSLVVQEMVT